MALAVREPGRLRRVLIRLLAPALLAAACATTPAPPAEPALADLESFAVQLQGVDADGAVNRLAVARTDLVVIDRPSSLRDRESWPTAIAVRQIHASPGAVRSRKLCLAYLNVGQAEEYRATWNPEWKAPFLVAPDPDGWPENHGVAYWDPAWEEVLLGQIDEIVAEGFDGAMLDWVAAWSDPAVAAAANAADVDPAEAMAGLIRRLGDRARAARPGFLLVLNGGAPLVEARPALAAAVNGVLRESTWFGGKASAEWNAPDNADLPATDTEDALAPLRAARAKGLAVFTLDYAADPAHREAALANARAQGFVPSVSRTPLDRIPAWLLAPREK